VNCDDYRAARLAGSSTTEMARHAEGCIECRSLAPLLDDAATELRDPAQWEEPPADLEDRIVAEISAAAGPKPIEVRQPRRRATRWMWLGAAAILIALAVAAGSRLGSGPDWTVQVPGTDLAPLATATVEGWNTDAGTRMLVHATGVDPAPDGFVYEMWLTSGHVHISGGTFRKIDGAELLVGVSRADYPRIWITLEAVDDDESPSPTTVLDTRQDL
jgi:hypothetical protein